jgi:hypothetical protein
MLLDTLRAMLSFAQVYKSPANGMRDKGIIITSSRELIAKATPHTKARKNITATVNDKSVVLFPTRIATTVGSVNTYATPTGTMILMYTMLGVL